MKQSRRLLLVFFLLAAPLFAQTDRAALQNRYMDHLKQNNLPASVDDDGNIAFKHRIDSREMTFYILVDEKDPQFFRIYKDDFWPVVSEQEKKRAFSAVNYANGANRTVKMYLDNNGVVVDLSAEILLARPENFGDVFGVMLREIEGAARVFFNHMETAE